MSKSRIYLYLLFSVFVISGCGGDTGDSNAGRASEAEKVIDTEQDPAEAALAEMTGELPDSIQEAIMASPEEFLEDMKGILALPLDLFLVADKQHFLGEDYIPADIVSLNSYPDLVISRDNLSLREALVPDLLRMTKAAGDEGITLVVSSTYRSYSYQDRLFKWNVEQNGLETAERESARPGTSQHQLGLAIDFGTITDDYAYTPAGQWLAENAGDFGFSLSYPEGYEDITGYRFECWHYRYITPEGYRIQHRYFNDLQYYFLIFLDKNRDILLTL